jgi:hypothetical protein
MYPFEDGWIDVSRAEAVGLVPDLSRDAALVRRQTDGFRGRILSEAYSLERSLNRLILWHLFRDRDDGTAAFFENNILLESGFGLERKVSLVCKIAEHWAIDEEDAHSFRVGLRKVKLFRDRVAHWPTWLQPLTAPDGQTVDYRVHITKGSETYALTEQEQTEWLMRIREVIGTVDELTDRIQEWLRSGLVQKD